MHEAVVYMLALLRAIATIIDASQKRPGQTGSGGEERGGLACSIHSLLHDQEL